MVAALVILVDEVLKAFLPDVSEKLSVFVGLIISNCIIMGRLEAFALGNKIWPSFLDAIGNAMGYAWILIVVAFFRELLGFGTLLDIKILPDFLNNGLMLLAPGAFIILGLIIWAQRSITNFVEE